MNYLKKTKYALSDYFFNKTNFNKIAVHISFKELEKIKNDRKKALNLKRLINPSKTKAKIIFNQKEYDAFVRLKGDLSDHWANIKQFSLKINLRDGKSILGMNEFSLIQHETREFPYNYLIENILEKHDLLNTKYETISVKVNGESWGLMLMEEAYSDSFYARHKIKEAPLFRFQSEISEIQQLLYGDLDNIDQIIKWQGKLNVETINSKKILKKSNVPNSKSNFNLLSIAKNINQEQIVNNEYDSKNIENYLNIEKFSRSLAIGLLFGSVHSFAEKNIRYYLNPYTLKLEPILRDHDPKYLNQTIIKMIPKEYKLLYKNQKFKKIFFETIDTLEGHLDLIRADHKEICLNFSKICNNLINYELINYNLDFIKKNFNNNLSILEDNVKKKFDTLNDDQINQKFYVRIFNDGTIRIANLTSETLRLKKIVFFETKDCTECEKKIIFINDQLKPSSYENLNISNFKLDVGHDKFDSARVSIIDEKNKTNIKEVLIEDFNFQPQRIFEEPKFKKFDFIKYDKEKLIIPSGTYVLDYPLFVPAGKDLIIEAGVNLSLNEDTYIFVEKGNVQFLGKEELPININSSEVNNFWRGIYVNSNRKSNQISNISFTNIQNVNFFDNKKFQLTGAINFINSNVNISNSTFYNSISEDFLNLVNSQFDINSVTVKQAISDGIDFDFSHGLIRNSSFESITGDAIDTSGSKISVQKVIFDNVGDKAISAGEESKLNLENLKISNSSIGIASKDKSIVEGEKINVVNCKKFDFAVYQKNLSLMVQK